MDKGTKVYHFLQDIKSIEFDAAVNVVCAQPEKYGKDFDVTLNHLGQMATKNGCTMQLVCIAKTWSQPAITRVAAFMGKIEYKKYPMTV